MTQYSHVKVDDFENLTVLLDGELVSITNQHPRFSEILELVENDETEGLQDLLDPSAALNVRFEKVGEQVSIKNGHVLFEGEEVNNILADAIVKFYSEGNDDFKPLVNFMEKLATNPNEHSKDHLFRWLKNLDLSIAENGDFIAYKGVDSEMRSIHSGFGIIDGVETTGKLLNAVGSVIEMPRSQVTFDPADGCSFGLHAGTWGYANSFGHTTLEVHINPRDVVSVPVDCADQKLRCCRYRVVQVLEKPYEQSLVAGTYDWDESDDDDDDDTATEPFGESLEVGATYKVIDSPSGTDGLAEEFLEIGSEVVVVNGTVDYDGEVEVRKPEDDNLDCFYIMADVLAKADEPEVKSDYELHPVTESPIYDQLLRNGF